MYTNTQCKIMFYLFISIQFCRILFISIPNIRISYKFTLGNLVFINIGKRILLIMTKIDNEVIL